MQRSLRPLLLTSLLVTLSFGCSSETSDIDSLTGPLDDQIVPQRQITQEDGYQLVEGVIGNGALYAIEMPDDWNGDLVIYARGFVLADAEVTLPTFPIQGLREAGYAIAYSSFSENGWAVLEGARATRQLVGIFVRHFSYPDRTYLVGVSMGGGIVTSLTETNPQLFDGTLCLCGILGGTKYNLDHVHTLRALFDYFYPDVLPGDAQTVPEDIDAYDAAFNVALPAIFANPGPVFELASVDQADLQFADPGELIFGLVIDLYLGMAAYPDMVERVNSDTYFDNSDVVYTGSSDDSALNAGIDRFEAPPQALNYLIRSYEPSGDLAIPLYALHTTRDFLVPVSHLDVYEDIVARHGNAEMLRTQRIDRWDHCAFTNEEMLSAFNDLVNWVDAMPEVAHFD